MKKPTKMLFGIPGYLAEIRTWTYKQVAKNYKKQFVWNAYRGEINIPREVHVQSKC